MIFLVVRCCTESFWLGVFRRPSWAARRLSSLGSAKVSPLEVEHGRQSLLPDSASCLADMSCCLRGARENASGERMFWNSSKNRPFFSDPGSHLTEEGVSSPGLCPETPATAGWLPQLMAGGGQTSQAAPQAGGEGGWVIAWHLPGP